mmetsp:Transcript_38130/g.46008  ORF Transcript_38130/g.46008 Transcript_38130/m.46008 type:complete len:82 (-) Transcript_38130:76-321(-)
MTPIYKLTASSSLPPTYSSTFHLQRRLHISRSRNPAHNTKQTTKQDVAHMDPTSLLPLVACMGMSPGGQQSLTGICGQMTK